MLREIFRNGTKLFSRRQSNIFSAATILAAAFGASALLGILRDRLLYARFYSCCAGQLDSYNAAFRLPDIVFRLLVTGALSAAFIPVFSEQLTKNKKAAYKMASSVINTLFLIFLGLSLLIVVFAYPLSNLIVSGFSQDQVLLMSQLTKIMIVSQLFFLLSSFLTGILQSHQRFLVPALAPVAYNIGIIFGIQVLSRQFGIFGPATGVMIGAALHFLVQLPLVFSLGFKHSFMISFKLEGVKRILRLMVPRTLSLGLGEMEATTALFLASGLPTGTVSLFYLGQRLTHFFARIFGVTIGQASLPALSHVASKNNFNAFVKILFNSLMQAIYFAFPAAIIFLVLRIPLVRLAYGAEEFPWQATLVTGKIIAYFAPLVIISTVNDILIRSFYALQDTRTPLVISVFSLITNVSIALLTIFRFNMGVVGLTMAITIAALVQALMLMTFLFKKIRVEDWKSSFFTPIFKISAASFILGITSWKLLRVLDTYVFDTSRISELIILVLIILLIVCPTYLFITLLFKLKEAKAVVKLLRKILSWFKPTSPIMELPPLPE